MRHTERNIETHREGEIRKYWHYWHASVMAWHTETHREGEI